jgi:hypothetical protein
MLERNSAKTCPACGQVVAPTGLHLPPIKALIYDTVQRRPGITPAALRDVVWGLDPNGGPLTGTKCLHVHVAQLNQLLAPYGVCVRSEGGLYQIRSLS